MLAVKAWIILSLWGSTGIFLFLLDKIATESKVMHWSAMIVSAKSVETWPEGMCGWMREAEGVLAPLFPLMDEGVPDKAFSLFKSAKKMSQFWVQLTSGKQLPQTWAPV